MSIYISHNLVDPDLFQLLLIIYAGFLIRCKAALPKYRKCVVWIAKRRRSFIFIQLVFEHAIIKVLDPLVSCLKIIRLQIQCSTGSYDRHAYIIELFGQIVSLQHISCTDSNLDINDIFYRYYPNQAFLAWRCCSNSCLFLDFITLRWLTWTCDNRKCLDTPD